jgi:hypothetical protein
MFGAGGFELLDNSQRKPGYGGGGSGMRPFGAPDAQAAGDLMFCLEWEDD